MTATREILWNVGSIWTYIVMYGSLACAMVVVFGGLVRRTELWLNGKESNDKLPPIPIILKNLTFWGVFQRGVVKKQSAGLIHTLIYLGFLSLLLATTVVFIHHDLGIKIYQGDFYILITILSDVLGLGVIIGCALAYHRRYIARDAELHSRNADSTMLALLVLLCVQGYLLEGLRIHVTNDPWAQYSPVGLLVAKLFWAVPAKAATAGHWAIWWFHAFTVFCSIAVLPYTKFFHILSSPLNLALRRYYRPKGALPFPGDLEKLMESAADDFSIGLGSIKDYSWKQRLDLDACTGCGRCQELCPAYNSGKPLSPKWIILDTRNHMLNLQADGKLADRSILPKFLVDLDKGLLRDFFLPKSGVGESDTAFRAQNVAVQGANISSKDVTADSRISGEVIDPMSFWSCTTCMACVAACPVGINHVDQIVENRRNMVLMQGEVPHEAQGTLKALENRANPYGPPEDRSNWLKGLDVKVLSPGDSVDYLYWVGCVSAFDPRKQKIAQSLVKIMKAAGLSFGVLGNQEGCSGDPARRLGEENLYQTLAKSNIELLKTLRFKTIVANCPHCFNTIKNEYPQLGNIGDGISPEIIHHSVLLKKLLREEKIKVNPRTERITFHDPCYLGRYNDEYEAPRDTLSSIEGVQITEMSQSREKGLCCGAGGGHFWMDFKVGTRINSLRVLQAEESGAREIATACPFCMQMMEDGVKINNLEDKLHVKDLAEIVAENLVDG